ncbi:nicotinate phosphoribosyltransferase [Hyalangium rubrum]|uniref:Nicotinate phosphoribosyltransferase n=1 Tax=Hyalangium rubrum TaxID=3103134 RepID=A0ABU5H9R6_9BACT|nr:nicotinate phosphoribosyltransferase [Hyalangium sp. s54d21]MDY7230224.1 nicotinate phosphoribosyltransferase [Hyalangium sp. s54d21]
MEEDLTLLTDLYEFAMVDAYLDEGMQDEAVFSLFVRRLPSRRNFLLACGLEEALRYLETLRFTPAALDYLASLGRFSDRLLRYLERFHFSGDVCAVPEGTPVFAEEPLLEVVAPLPEAQLVETYLLNQVHLQTLAASKAVRVTEAAAGRPVMEFGVRRTHGVDAGMKVARAAFIAGVGATSNVRAGRRYGIPVAGTMAHSFVQAHEDELEAFRAFSSRFPETTLLVDTYDTLRGVQHVVRLARELGEAFQVRAVRLDSGDMLALSRATRQMLDEAGLQRVKLIASGNLDEDSIQRLLSQGAPIDSFGVGTSLGVSSDVPCLDMVYKLVAYAGKDRIKLSTSKVLYPGRKQVYRVEEHGVARKDVLARHGEMVPGRPLLRPMMREGKRVAGASPSLVEIQEHTRRELSRLPPEVRRLEPLNPPYRVEASPVVAWTREQLIEAWAATP